MADVVKKPAYKGPALNTNVPAGNANPKAVSPRKPQISPPASPRNALNSPKANSPTSAVKWQGMSEVCLREPVVRVQFYGRGDIAGDLINLYHNAIKREIQDLYCMISSMMKRTTTLLDEEFDQLDTWYELFTKFVKWYMNDLEPKLFDFIDGKILSKIDRKISFTDREKFGTMKRLAEVQLNRVHEFFDLAMAQIQAEIQSPNQVGKCHVDPVLVQSLITVNDGFMEALLEFLFAEESLLIALLQGNISVTEKDKFEDEVFGDLHNAGVDGHLNFLIMLRAVSVIEGDNAAATLKKRYLDRYSAVSLKARKVTKLYAMSRDLWMEKHANVFKQFLDRWNAVASANTQFKFQQFGSGRMDVAASSGNSSGGVGSGRFNIGSGRISPKPAAK
eukprot:CAMPEP_0184695978 /NCGR_PEP_ID=MMETSP0313-20130426/3424_1 /TAXON_ID=2792 /ORGANISM="Porphyridium aerugineum, Strain SAG 1380-2" /LENGTH=390 /DNA_ID=CAMNT_0027154517 /DNA_START=264 /DNA_END=1436 /DNA_ORIENTATION=+